MPVNRTAWRIERAGSLSRLRQVDESLPDPPPGQARLRVEAIGLNFADVLACMGLYSATPQGSFVPGLECAGVVESVGAGAPVAVGERLCVLTRFGGYASRLNFEPRYSIPVPGGWSAAEAAAWPVQGLTAWYGLCERARVARGECVLLQSAAGGVGLQALTILGTLEARVIAVVSSERKREFLQARHGLPPAAIVVRDRGRFAAQLDHALEAVGAGGFDVVFDAVFGPGFKPAFARLRPEGRYLLFGAADFMPAGRRPAYPALAWRYLRRPRVDPLAMITANRCLIGFNLIWLWDDAQRMPAAIESLRRLGAGRAPHIGERLSFDDAPRAMRLLQSGRSVGKVVLELPEDVQMRTRTSPLTTLTS
jgi:alcohol dehydrogenase